MAETKSQTVQLQLVDVLEITVKSDKSDDKAVRAKVESEDKYEGALRRGKKKPGKAGLFLPF